MDSGMPTWIIPVAGIIGGFVGWASTQYWQQRHARRQKTRDATATLIKGRAFLIEMINKSSEPKLKQVLNRELDEVDAAILEEIRQAVQFVRSKQ